MTWSAFFNALRGGAQNRVQSVRQGVNRATQQTTTRPAQRAAVSTKAVDNIKQDDFDFLGMDVSIHYLEYFYHLRFHLNVLLHGYHSLTHVFLLVLLRTFQKHAEPWMTQVIVHN